MATKAKKTKRPPGRPKLAAGKKAEQFSISLAPTQRIGLEMIARHRGVSLSKAVEYCVSSSLREYKIDGETIDSHMHKFGHGDSELSEMHEFWAATLVADPARKVLAFPASLRTPEEQYFKRICETAEIDEIAASAHANQLLKLAKRYFSEGRPESEVVAIWRRSQDSGV